MTGIHNWKGDGNQLPFALRSDVSSSLAAYEVETVPV